MTLLLPACVVLAQVATAVGSDVALPTGRFAPEARAGVPVPMGSMV